jgi:signal transduction histidine kinase
MFPWSVYHLFLANAALLMLLALFLVWRKQNRAAWIFFTANTALAFWSVCVFILGQKLLLDYASIIARLQLVGGMIFASALFYFASSYPVYQDGKSKYLHALAFILLAAATIGTNFTTEVQIVDGDVVFNDGYGYVLVTAYISVVSISALYRLVQSWQKNPEYRSRIKYFFVGIAIYVSCSVVFNLVLPSFFDIYDFLIVGRLSATVAPLFIFYAIVKHEFLDTTVIINRGTAWFVTLALMLAIGLSLDSVTSSMPTLNFLVFCVVLAGAAFFAHPLQQFLLTTAKRKFVRSWYSTEEVINRLSGKITQEKNREAIFKEVVKVLDEVFQLEDVLTIIAVRDEHEAFSYYKIVGRFQRIKPTDPLIEHVRPITDCMRLEEASSAIAQRLEELQFGRGRGVFLPLHSPEFLEGIIFLGERSNQAAYNESDMRFFNNLVRFLSPILYRLTPMEKLEHLYSESRQKLHEAEIQLIRAQKIESIVHATRQCHHEIRTPLNIIKMGIGRIKTLEDLENYKEVAREEINHALEIVDETLTVADVDRSSGNRAMDININEVIQRCQRLIDRSRYKVELDLGELPEIPAVFSDIQVVITNLIHNAMEAMPGGGSLAFTSRATPTDVVITVEDDGEGIPEALRSKVWEPYFSGRGSKVGNSNAGRGWGLTIVNRIVTAHQGTIRFTSEEKVGTKFIITLPRRKEESQKGQHLSQAYP